MNRKLLKLTALLLILAVALASSCQQEEPKPQEIKQEEPIINYPIEISFEDYLLKGTFCQLFVFTNLNDEVRIINTNEELENYITCLGNDSYPIVDFSRYTLLLGNGRVSPYYVTSTHKKLQQISAQSYVMNVDLNLRAWLVHVETYWEVAIIVDKIADNAHIELILTKNIQS